MTINPVTRHCNICGLTHELGPIALETECVIALRAEVKRLSGVLSRVRAINRTQAEAEWEARNTPIKTGAYTIVEGPPLSRSKKLITQK